jgi:histidinol-phosphatase (PHP family)
MTGPAAGTRGRTSVPGDSHVHSQFSWDTVEGDMAATCARAVDLGLPYVAFTEHVDLTDVVLTPDALPFFPAHLAAHVGDDLVLRAPALDVEGYLATVEQCRRRFPGLTILTGLEISEPHWHPEAVAALLAGGRFDRILGSLHSLISRDAAADVYALMHERGADAAMREYLAEAYRLASSTAPVAVLAHVDYPVREWSRFSAHPYDPFPFEAELREVLTALAASGRALELNTVVPLAAQVLRWWHECGGTEVTFAGDAHRPDDVGRGFADAAALAEAVGFRPRQDLRAPWCRG